MSLPAQAHIVTPATRQERQPPLPGWDQSERICKSDGERPDHARPSNLKSHLPSPFSMARLPTRASHLPSTPMRVAGPCVGLVRSSIWKLSRLTKQRIVSLARLYASLALGLVGLGWLAGVVSGPIFTSSKSRLLVVKASPSRGQARVAGKLGYYRTRLDSLVRPFHRVDAARPFRFCCVRAGASGPYHRCPHLDNAMQFEP